MASLEELEPAWTMLHNAHAERRKITFSRGGLTIRGYVIGFDSRDGLERVTMESEGGAEIALLIAGGEAKEVLGR